MVRHLSPKIAVTQLSPISVRDFSTTTVPTANCNSTTDNHHNGGHVQSDGAATSSKNLIHQLNFVSATTAFASTPIKSERTQSESSIQSKRSSSESSRSSVLSEGSSWYTHTVMSSGGATATVSASLMNFENLFACGAPPIDDSFSTFESKRNAMRRRHSSKALITSSIDRSLSPLDEEEESMRQIMSFTKGEAVINLDEKSPDGKASLSWVLKEGNRTEVRVAKIPYDSSICQDKTSAEGDFLPKENRASDSEADFPTATTPPVFSSQPIHLSETTDTKKITQVLESGSASASGSLAPVKKTSFFKIIWKRGKKDCGEF